MAQWTECQPVNQKVAGSTLSQGRCLGCGPYPWVGAYERQPPDVSLSLSPSPPLSLKINKILKKKYRGINKKIETYFQDTYTLNFKNYLC